MQRDCGKVFVISDLHLGAGDARDNFSICCQDQDGHQIDRRQQFLDFLDYVEGNGGQLIILGDLFEFWQTNIGQAINYNREILNRLAAMGAVYVIGNHDSDLEPLIGTADLSHPFFSSMTKPYTMTLGGKIFKFMHGHEVDSINSDLKPNFGRALTILAAYLEDFNQSPVTKTGSTVEKTAEVLALALLAQSQSWWGKTKSRVLSWFGVSQAIQKNAAKHLTPSQNPSRLSEQLELVRSERSAEGYDFAVAGHTHTPGTYEDWYFNSGSWVEINEKGLPINNFLCIETDGTVKVFDWTSDGPVENQTKIRA